MPTEAEKTERLESLWHPPQRWLKPTLLAGLGVAGAICVIGLTSRVLASQKLVSWTAAQEIPTVDVVTPTRQAAGQTLALPGDVEAFYNASIHARVSGYLRKWYEDIGAHVRAGQVLANIDTPELDQQLAQAKANLAMAISNQKLAQITSTRWANLLTKDAVSQQETEEKAGDLEAKTSAVNAARADVDRLGALETFKRIVAPFDGVVTARTTDVGALIAAGSPTDPGLFTVSDTHRLRVYVHVPQSYSAQLTPGTTVTLTVPDYPGRTFQATLVSTSDAISAQSGTLLVELQADNAAQLLKPGDYAQVRFNLPAAGNTLRVPASALMFRQEGMAVATVGPNSRVAMKRVTIGHDLGAVVEIATGIDASDRVIDNPPDSLNAGDLVRIAGASAQRLAAAGSGN